MSNVVQLVYADRSRAYVKDEYSVTDDLQQARIAYSDVAARAIVRRWSKLAEDNHIYARNVVAVEIHPIKIVLV